MPRLKKEGTALPKDISMLDDLVAQCYKELLKSMQENAKLGDFIKMLQLRRELAPAQSEQDQFWKMLEEVRRETLSERRPRRTRRSQSVPEKEEKE